ncbi:MAG: haloacid dehalogenase type II [Candidatus Rokuibacteriota bacterium]|nr:MAG: haloacid dehalogenase type II [Candidatus Rokubacteria bacterium]PYN20452.1 MAG: haloacid dehalogenase type II [Candidatus Rokubacteria bacterium]
MRRYDVLTFDCYGTLIDWERGIGDAFEAAARADGVSLDRTAVLRTYHEIEPAIETDRYRPYREVLTLSAQRVAERLGWPLAAGRAAFLAESLPSWPPFADTNAALQRLAGAGYRLAILSNVDDDLLAGTRKHLGVSFEFVVTAEQVGSYKPAPVHFTTARQRIAGARWLHVAQSWFHDVQPAQALGIPIAWINRRQQRRTDGVRPDFEFPTLGEAAAWLTSA